MSSTNNPQSTPPPDRTKPGSPGGTERNLPSSQDDDGPTKPPSNGGTEGHSRSLSPQTMAATTAVSAMADIPSRPLHEEEDIISSDDENTHRHSNTSSVQVTPIKKQTRFLSRTSTRSLSSSQTSAETGVLSCQLALLAALTAEMETSVNVFEKEQWQTRIFQVNQVMQMVQWEANGLYGISENNQI